MPAAETVLLWATGVANDWRGLATMWHVALGVLLVTLSRSYVSQRLLGFLLTLPLASVAVLATVSWNPFNALMFTALTILLLRSATHLPATPPHVSSRRWVFAGVPLIAFGWWYPHFLATDTWTAYAYASPFGLLPCPTLSVVIGVTLAVGGLRAGSWNAVLAAAGVLYGAIGVFTLGVALDVWLLAGAIALAILAAAELVLRRVRATEEERTRRLPGDELIQVPTGAMTNAITLAAAPAAVWPWLAQMGAGSRAGWYSYDVLDNRRRPSATRIIPELQHISIGDIFPALPGITEGFILLAFERDKTLVLGWRNSDGLLMVTWAFLLEAQPGQATRLIVRARYRAPDQRRLPLFVIRFEHFVMQRKQLLGIARRVESRDAALADAA